MARWRDEARAVDSGGGGGTEEVSWCRVYFFVQGQVQVNVFGIIGGNLYVKYFYVIFFSLYNYMSENLHSEPIHSFKWVSSGPAEHTLDVH